MNVELDMMSSLIGAESESQHVNNSEPQTNMFDMQEESVSQTEDNAVIKLNRDDCVSVSDIILNNVDKHINMSLCNGLINVDGVECDLTNYIVYINHKKHIPCIFDCEKLYVPKSSVLNDNGEYLVESIEGRRSGFVIKLTNNRHLVMTKNFIYEVIFENNRIRNVYEYNRKIEKTSVEIYPMTDFDSISLSVRNVLPKIVKKGNCETVEQLHEEVRKCYNSVDDVNALFKIIYLMYTIGA